MSDAGSTVSDADVQLLNDTAAAAQAGDFPRASALAERALANGLHHPLFYRLRGLKHEQSGRAEAAMADYRAALADQPDDVVALDRLGVCLARLGRPAEAMAALDRGLAVQPGFAALHHDRAWVLETLGDLPGARAGYARTLELDPRHARAQAALALLAARAGQWAQARDAAAKALAIDPGSAGARIAQAMATLGEGDAAGAEREARALLAGPPLVGDERGVTLTLLGDAIDQQDRASEAFGTWLSANQTLRDAYASQFALGGAAPGLAVVERLRTAFDRTRPADWRRGKKAAVPASPAARHVFVLGFPRSGTTLLGQVLAAHPDVTTLDELETLAEAGRAFLSDEEGLARLAAASDDELDRFRDAYWGSVRSQGVEPQGRTFVDKLPMNTLGLPLIARLFPQAKVVFVRRDPRDVLLSCFRRQFVINGTNWEFLSLPGAARFYDAVMRLAEGYAKALPLDMTVLRYEDLVGDLAGASAKLCAFIGLAPDPAMAAFAGSAAAADIATPSAAQVSGAVFGEGVGQWRRYQSQLAPVLPTLAPWVEAFGY